MEEFSSSSTATTNTREGDSAYKSSVNNSNYATHMADNSQDNNNMNYSASDPNNSNESKREVCRDFLNKICVRGQHCKYYHPNDAAAPSSIYSQSVREDFQFCGDFHKRGCCRSTCRYVHCSLTCMEEFESSGQMSEELAAALVAIGYDEVDGRPLCKEYMNGKCARGKRCRFWHIIPNIEREKRARIQSGQELAPPKRSAPPPPHTPHQSNYYYGSIDKTQSPEPYYPPSYVYSAEPKRSRYRGSSAAEYVIAAENGYGSGPSSPWSPGGGTVPAGLLIDPHMGAYHASRHHHETGQPPLHSHYMLHSPPGGGATVAVLSSPPPPQLARERDSISPGLWSLLNSENVELQRTFELLTKTVNDLRATNETLLAENALLRTNLQHVSHVTHAAGATNKEAATAVAAAAHMTNVLAAQSAAAASQTTRTATLTPDQLAAYTVAAAAQQAAAVVEPSMTLTVPTVVYSSLNAFQR